MIALLEAAVLIGWFVLAAKWEGERRSGKTKSYCCACYNYEQPRSGCQCHCHRPYRR